MKMNKDKQKRVAKFVKTRYPSERERIILELRFGLRGEPQTLEEVGKVLNVTRERVRQLEYRALKKMDLVDGIDGGVDKL